MRTNRAWFRQVPLAAIALLLALQTAAASGQDTVQDPPSRVARLNYVSGSVFLQPEGHGDWGWALVNRPLTTDDNLWTEKNSRAELHVGSTPIRLNSETGLTVLRVDDHAMQFGVSFGSVIVDLRHVGDGDLVEVETPNLAFSLLSNGEYRVDVNRAGDETVVTAWKGQGEATRGESSFTVVAGEQVAFKGTGPLTHEVSLVGDPDDFEKWAFARDIHEQQADSDYVSDRITGYEDLDAYGRWDYGDEGLEWIPNDQPVGWAPFAEGEWSWIDPWGWTWVDAEPWGFAPFHYGRWTHNDQGWCWLPGQLMIRNVYMPAPVVFVTQPAVASRAGTPRVAWMPLGPHEIYVPPYRASAAYIHKVNLTNTVTDLARINIALSTYSSKNADSAPARYINRSVPNGVTTVSEKAFVEARPIGKSFAAAVGNSLAVSRASFDSGLHPADFSGNAISASVHPSSLASGRPVVASSQPASLHAAFVPADRFTSTANNAPFLATGIRAQTPIPASLSIPLPGVKLTAAGRAQDAQASHSFQSGQMQPIPFAADGAMASHRDSGGDEHAIVVSSNPGVRAEPRVGESSYSGSAGG